MWKSGKARSLEIPELAASSSHILQKAAENFFCYSLSHSVDRGCCRKSELRIGLGCFGSASEPPDDKTSMSLNELDQLLREEFAGVLLKEVGSVFGNEM